MKFLIAFAFTTVTYFSQAQLLSGTIVESNRKMVSTYTFKIKGKYKGVKYFSIAVNNEGKVTSVKEDVQSDSFVSTPAMLIAIKELQKLLFEKGTHFPKFQHAIVKVEFVKE
jgi:hypothetical protein